MALIPLSYCNGSLGLNYSFNYNNVTHALETIVEGAACGPGGLPSGFQLYTHIDGSNQWYVYTQNTYPYGYVSSLPIIPCSVSITSVVPGNASNNYANDGTIIINATGPFPKQYILAGYSLSYQVSNTFTGLPPGTYTARVQSLGPDGICSDEELNVVVGFNTVVCQLELGNIVVTGESTIGANDGQISVNTLTNPPALPVEYRLDAGAWQDSPVFPGLAADTYSVQVRYKSFTSCGASRNVVVQEGVSCDIFIQAVNITHETAKYADDGTITIIANTTHGPLEYSIDDGDNYQSENLFQDVPVGEYTVRVRDAEGCEDSMVISVLKFKRAYLVIPRVNSHRFVITSGPMINASARQNFDNRLFKDMKFPGVSKCDFKQPVELGDAITIQFKSNYTGNIVTVYNSSDTAVGTLTALKKTSHLNKTDSRAGFFSNAGAGQTQIFFENGIPSFYEVGQDITISGEATLNGTHEVVEIRQGTGEAEGYEVLIIDADYTSLTALTDGTVDMIYDVEPYEVWEFLILWSAYAAGEYYIKIEGTDVQLLPYVAQSEPVLTRETWADRVLIKARNNDNDYDVDYSTGIVHCIRVKGEFKWPLPGSKRTVMEDSRDRLIKLEERLTFNPQLLVFDQPFYMLMKLAAYFAHDYFEIDEVEHQSENDFEPEYFQNDATGNGKIKVRQVDYLAENSDDTGTNDLDINILGTNDTLLGVP